MSYSIIFETKIVLLSDGKRLIHFDRSGCNNDNSGRRRDDFTAKIYSIEDFKKMAHGFIDQCKPYSEGCSFDLKIGSRYATMHDYGKHLLRMMNRAVPYSHFIIERYVSATRCTAVDFIEPVTNTVSVREFSDTYHALMKEFGHVRYRRILEFPDMRNEKEICKIIESDKNVSFNIGKKRKY